MKVITQILCSTNIEWWTPKAHLQTALSSREILGTQPKYTIPIKHSMRSSLFETNGKCWYFFNEAPIVGKKYFVTLNVFLQSQMKRYEPKAQGFFLYGVWRNNFIVLLIELKVLMRGTSSKHNCMRQSHLWCSLSS